ncbi:MAG TPA: hypothetical protein VHC96_05310 [Puia sp.]|jgi:hypothetical protein|nr:hypothetical protein [Puia sp.]
MKLAFFLVAFCLILFRMYYKSIWPAAFAHRHRTSITISTDGDYEQIRYEGRIRLTEDEAGIAFISPGGSIRYRHNDLRLEAESDDQGHVVYDIRNNGRDLSPEGDGRFVIKEALRQMIVYGFDARGRMDRLYQRGGDSALRSELDQLKGPGLADMYRKFLASHQESQDTVRPEDKH